MFHSKVETDGKSLNAENQVFKRGNEEPPTQSAKKNKLPALSSADLQQNDGSESFERALFEKGLLPIETGKVTDDSEWTVDTKDLLDTSLAVEVSQALQPTDELSSSDASLDAPGDLPCSSPVMTYVPLDPLSDSDFD
ncbi:hypothetical protein WA538_002075, partial [Blastocystis sp. DL]